MRSPCSVSVSPLIVASQRLGKHGPPGERIHATIDELWPHRFLRGACRIKGKQAISSTQNFNLAFILSVIHMYPYV
jgi:hypothetical protein